MKYKKQGIHNVSNKIISVDLWIDPLTSFATGGRKSTCQHRKEKKKKKKNSHSTHEAIICAYA